MIFQGEMKIFRMVSYKSLDFGALILGINSLLIIKTFLQRLYIKFSSFPLNHSRKVVVSYKRKFVHEVLVNCLFKLAQEKVWSVELTVPP